LIAAAVRIKDDVPMMWNNHGNVLCGLEELITHSLGDYESLAVALASDPVRLGSVRQKLAAGRMAAPLFDTDGFRRHLEAAYKRMHEIAQAGGSPRSFAIEPER
jgi:protein O-GlcNAc transferase